MLPSIPIQNPKKVIKIVFLVILGLVLAAVIWGVISALFGGNMMLGWRDYRYDESAYTIGEGSIPYDNITAIDLDWIDGKIEIVSCGDTYVSLTESAEGELSNSEKLRWSVDENGVLSIKYRKSSWFLGFGYENRGKSLILRIPERMLSTLEHLNVETLSSEVTVNEIDARSFVYKNVTGNLIATNCCFDSCDLSSSAGDIDLPDCRIGSAEATTASGNILLYSQTCPSKLTLETKGGEVEILIPVSSSFTLYHETKSGQLSSDFSMQKLTDRYVCRDGAATFTVKTASGSVYITQNNDIE